MTLISKSIPELNEATTDNSFVSIYLSNLEITIFLEESKVASNPYLEIETPTITDL